MSILSDAKQNLANHGVDVEIPKTVKSHEKLNPQSEVFSSFGLQEGLEAATYSYLNDRMDIYTPLAINRAIHELDDEAMDQVTQAMERNRENFSRELRRIQNMDNGESFAGQVNLARLHYNAAINDDQIDQEIQNDLRESVESHMLHDSEHELIHASHYQNIIEGDVEPLQEDFERYIEDIKDINSPIEDYDKREHDTGVSSLEDIEMAAAVSFLDEDRLQNIVSLAGREEKKWSQKCNRISQEYVEKEEQVKDDVKEGLDIEASMLFDGVAHQLASVLTNNSRAVNDAGELIDKMEEDEVDEYRVLRDAGVRRSELENTISQLSELNQESLYEVKEFHIYAEETGELLEDAILREAELQGGFEEFLQPYVDRLEKGQKIPGDYTEAFAQFWSAYRRGDLEGDRDRIFKNLEGYDIEGLENTMDDLLSEYDELEGSPEEKVTQVMSSQQEYLENNYDIDL